MKCQKCKLDFPEKEIQLSHDVPRYIGGTDKDGRHNLCIKCHDIYERIVFSMMVKPLPLELKGCMIQSAKRFALTYFKKEEGENEP